jgi:hypothetical protein
MIKINLILFIIPYDKDRKGVGTVFTKGQPHNEMEFSTCFIRILENEYENRRKECVSSDIGSAGSFIRRMSCVLTM